MLKRFKLFLILITLLYLPLQSNAQSISISPTPTLQDAQVLYFSNFDIFNVGNAQYLFDLSIIDVEPGTAADNPAHLEIEFYLDSKLIASAISDEFFARINTNSRYQATNIQLINFNQIGAFINLNFSTTFDPPDENFEDEFYGSGKARRGFYRLKASLYMEGVSGSPFSTEINILVKNPSDIQLSTPGNRAGAGTPPETNDFPIFTFFSDGTEYTLKVYEKLAHHNSVEDVINSGNPICEEPLTIPVLNYAAATTGQPLQIGHTYYWFVDVLVPTTAGTETFHSEVFQFKVTQGTGSNAEGTAVASIIEMLRPIVGNQVDELSKTLSDFELKNIRLNGKPITIYELHQIIDGYDGHLVEILGLVLE